MLACFRCHFCATVQKRFKIFFFNAEKSGMFSFFSLPASLLIPFLPFLISLLALDIHSLIAMLLILYLFYSISSFCVCAKEVIFFRKHNMGIADVFYSSLCLFHFLPPSLLVLTHLPFSKSFSHSPLLVFTLVLWCKINCM